MCNTQSLLATMGIFSFLFGGCSKEPLASSPAAAPSLPLSAPVEVTSQGQEEGFHDLLFYIEEHKRLPDGSQSIRGSGTHKGRRLGFDVVLGPKWQTSKPSNDVPIVTHRGGVAYRSAGADSDAFLQALDELYETKTGAEAMGEETRFDAIALEGDPRDLGKGPVKIKLFFLSDREDEYAELFTNIDLPARRLEVREKDPEYRLAVVKALRAKG